MTGDPDDRSWLDYDAVNARWNDRYVRFIKHLRPAPTVRRRRLDELFVGPKQTSGPS